MQDAVLGNKDDFCKRFKKNLNLMKRSMCSVSLHAGRGAWY